MLAERQEHAKADLFFSIRTLFAMTTPARNERQARLIELRVRDAQALFNSMDPSPFNTKDLDHDAEEFIVSWAREYPLSEPLQLRIHLERWPEEDPTELIRDGVHNYFAYRTKLVQLELRQLFKYGRISLVIGLAFLVLCLMASELLLAYDTAWGIVLRESLAIAGWVAMWKPLETYLYDWWPVRHRGRVHAKLSSIPIEVSRAGEATS